MKDFIMTFKFLLKQSFSFNYIAFKIKENKISRNMFAIIVIALILCLPSYILLISGLTKLYKTYQTFNLQSLFIVMALFLAILIIFFFGMLQIISYFYFSKDIKLLFPLPIKPKNYLLSKFFVIYIWELIFILFFIAPFFVIYGVYSHLQLYQWITMMLSLLLVPLIPLVVVGLITIILMLVTNASKNKNALRLLGYTILVGGLIVFQLFFYRNLISENPEEQIKIFEKLIKNSSYFLERFSMYYPITKLIELTIYGSFIETIIGLISLIIISLIVVYLFSLFLEKVYLNSYLKEQSQDILKKRVKQVKIISRPVSVSIAKIDFITLLKEPIFVFNTLGVVIMLPVILIISTLIANGNNELNQLIMIYNSNKIEAWLIITLFLVITSSMIPIVSTTFSREGTNNWIMRTLPIKSQDHILGRLITPFLMQFILNFIIILIIIINLIRSEASVYDSILYGLISLISSLIMTIPLFFSMLFVDLKRPMLKWENPQQPVKQNMNIVISIGIGLFYGLLLYLIYQFLLKHINNNLLIFLIYCIIGISLAIIINQFLKNNFDKNLVEMDYN